jgi:hypothetical protein
MALSVRDVTFASTKQTPGGAGEHLMALSVRDLTFARNISFNRPKNLVKGWTNFGREPNFAKTHSLHSL